MVANGDTYGTLIDANEAANMQQKIREKDLRISHINAKPYPSYVYFYMTEQNKAVNHKTWDCLGKVAPITISMLTNFFVPTIHYTTTEIKGPKSFFTESPYTGSIILGILGVLMLIGGIIDFVTVCCRERNTKQGKKDLTIRLSL